MIVKGSFEVTPSFDPPYETVEGVTLGRASFDKRFSGALDATGKVHMLAARTAVTGSAGYVAAERVTGSLGGRTGTFVLLHTGIMTRGAPSLTVVVAPDSGTGELTGLSGRMNIEIVEGKHFYEFDYTLAT